MSKGVAGRIKINTFNDLVGGNAEEVTEVKLSELHEFKDHPYKVLDDEKMAQTVESIKMHGVLVPGIVRPRPEGGFEIISGHRRKRACELAGLISMPVLIKQYDNDESVIAMVDSNLQRDELLPSEKAFAYKMKFDAMSHQGKQTDEVTSTQVGWKLETASVIGQPQGDSKNQVRRYIRLTELLPKLLDMVDCKMLKINPAVEISYLKKKEQEILMEVMEEDEAVPTLVQAQQLKRLSQEKAYTRESVHAILITDKVRERQFTIRREVIRQYFEPETSDEEIETVICSLLENWKERASVKLK